nr:NADH dehydrogenase subunit 5 [Semimytilus algosus]
MMNSGAALWNTKWFFWSVFCALVGYSLLGCSLVLGSCSFVDLVLYSDQGVSVSFSVLIDSVSVMFTGVVLIIYGSVVLYSSWYMSDEKFKGRFLWLICAFVAFMLILIFSANLVVLMLGWDGLGLTSFLLVCYYESSSSLRAGMLTVLTNRLGDVMILMAIALASCWGDWLVFNMKESANLISLSFLLVVASMTKSAQMPFSAWLPAAMAAPTPVSSLVHSSTLVTAGVYLMIRCSSFCGLCEEMMTVLKLMSVLTMAVAGLSGSVENDFKKVIALSTLSQLSLMMFSVGQGFVWVSFFHLVNHASLKSLLFLSAGVVIHMNKNCQDLRHLGGCWSSLPISSSMMVVSSMSLVGLPFMSGFYSKDLIVELSLNASLDIWLYLFMLLGVLLTSWYSMRNIYSIVTGLNRPSFSESRFCEPWVVVLSYSLLLGCAIFSGGVLSVKVSGVFFIEFVSPMAHVLLLSAPFLGAFLYVTASNLGSVVWWPSLGSFVLSMMNLVGLSWGPVCFVVFECGKKVSSCLDKGWLEEAGPSGVMKVSSKVSQVSQRLQSQYFVKMLGVGMLLLILFFLGLCGSWM